MVGAEPKKRGKGEVRRDALLDALENELRTRRLEDVSVARLSATAGVTRSAFYFYFDSKEVAALAVLAELLEVADDEGESILSASPDGHRRHVRRSISATVAATLRHAHVYRAVLDARATHEGVRENWLANRAEITESVAGLIRTLRETGQAPDGPDPTILASVLVQLNESLLDHAVWNPDENPEERIGVVADIWVSSIFGSMDDVQPL